MKGSTDKKKASTVEDSARKASARKTGTSTVNGRSAEIGAQQAGIAESSAGKASTAKIVW